MSEAMLEDYSRSLVVPSLDTLTKAYLDNHVDSLFLRKIVNSIEGFVGYDYPTTSDGYTWFFGAYFAIGKGEVAVLFPWKNPKTEDLERAFALYEKGSVLRKDVDSLVAILSKGLLS